MPKNQRPQQGKQPNRERENFRKNKTGEDELCCSSSVMQTRPGPSSLLEEWSKTPIVFVVFFVLSATPQKWGKQPRYIDIEETTIKPNIKNKKFDKTYKVNKI